MRGWENAFLSQQQMLASHTAALRALDRRSHHKPLHHLELLFTYFWEPYLWLSQVFISAADTPVDAAATPSQPHPTKHPPHNTKPQQHNTRRRG